MNNTRRLIKKAYNAPCSFFLLATKQLEVEWYNGQKGIVYVELTTDSEDA